MPNQTYIPPEEWSSWSLRGRPPIIEGETPVLSIDIMGKNYPDNIKLYKGKSLKYEWNTINNKLNDLHNSINLVYSNIIEQQTEG